MPEEIKEEYNEMYDRFEDSLDDDIDFNTFEDLLHEFTIWGGKNVIPTNKQITMIKDIAEDRKVVKDEIIKTTTKSGKEREIHINFVIVKEMYKNGRFTRRFVDTKTGKYVSKQVYEDKFLKESNE